MRKYEETHSWIDFELNLKRFSRELWMLLGEAQSKCEHIAGVPIEPEVAGKLLQVYLAKGVLATTAIEGNTLSEEQVVDKLAGKLKLPPSQDYLGQEIDNIIEGCNQIKNDLMQGGSADINVKEIMGFNKIALKKLPLTKEVKPGKIRTHSVGVGRYRGVPAEDCEYLLGRMCEWLNSSHFFPSNNVIVNGIIKAVVAHLYIAWIHPFADGNGRTARLVELKILIASGIPTPASQLLSNHYNKTRTEYYRRLDLSSKSKNNEIHFVHYAIVGFVDGLKEQLALIRSHQHKIAWKNYIYSRFKKQKGQTSERRRELVLALSEEREADDAVELEEMRHLNMKLYDLYANKTDLTIRRDVMELLKMGLIKKTGKLFLANSKIIEAFLPERRTPDL